MAEVAVAVAVVVEMAVGAAGVEVAIKTEARDPSMPIWSPCDSSDQAQAD